MTARKRLNNPATRGYRNSSRQQRAHQSGLPAPAETLVAWRIALSEGRSQHDPMTESPDAVPGPHWPAVEAFPAASPGPPFPVQTVAGSRVRVSTCCLSLRAKFPSPGPRKEDALLVPASQPGGLCDPGPEVEKG